MSSATPTTVRLRTICAVRLNVCWRARVNKWYPHHPRQQE